MSGFWQYWYIPVSELVFYFDFFFVFFSITIIMKHILAAYRAHFFDFLPQTAGKLDFGGFMFSFFSNSQYRYIPVSELVFYFDFFFIFLSIAIIVKHILAPHRGHFFDFLPQTAGKTIFYDLNLAQNSTF